MFENINWRNIYSDFIYANHSFEDDGASRIVHFNGTIFSNLSLITDLFLFKASQNDVKYTNICLSGLSIGQID